MQSNFEKMINFWLKIIFIGQQEAVHTAILLTVVYFFMLVYFLAKRTRNVGLFWPISVILMQMYALLSVQVFRTI